ncbi:Methyltransferase domain-containing protein [Paenibacillus sp. UNCCL117]|uniref:methyltransferase domain-containing protein n=1 Tax=unclassified Paenibacillus TaxID=185978 RepID=UPI000881337A|nr:MULTISPECIES: methyltransferase domain-containing protein [unclassified Paenibacillus]SDD91686.1 Methyltransferase domain-containing protein [Paenibacillus sp. cl123]SFW43651.1 Methyltransferase domain-containing protein [Paenibacillus sp. UNCCL117]
MNDIRNVIWTEPEEFLQKGIERIIEVDVLLDIGCGIVPHDDYILPKVYICCEPYQEYIEILNEKIDKKTNTIFVVLNYDWEAVVNHFADESVDTVFLLDVIEHLDKETGKQLLARTERIARKQIVIFTPLGFVENETMQDGKDAWGLNGAEWQKHRSGWVPEEFDGTWDIVACENFHSHNNIGQKLEEPFGAFWAIKNKKLSDTTWPSLINNKENLVPSIMGRVDQVIQLLKAENVSLYNQKLNCEKENFDLSQELLLEKNQSLTKDQMITSLQDTLAESKENIAALKDDITTLKDNISVQSDNVIRLGLEKDKLEKEKVKTLQDLEVLNMEKQNLMIEKLKLEERCSTLEHEINAFRHRYRFLERFRGKQ